MAKGKKSKAKEGKKPHKNKPTSKKYTKYKIVDGKIIREKFCPRCGPGVFLMNATGRLYCGKCHYSEFETKK
jgi:ubiquitin-small subunit ribosomal protein S27Ae